MVGEEIGDNVEEELQATTGGGGISGIVVVAVGRVDNVEEELQATTGCGGIHIWHC